MAQGSPIPTLDALLTMVTDRTLRRSSKIVVNIFETIYNMSSLFVHIQLLLFELINYRYKLVYEY